MYTDLKVVHFNPRKREFSLLINIPRAPHSVSEIQQSRTITCTNIDVLLNIGPGAREEGVVRERR